MNSSERKDPPTLLRVRGLSKAFGGVPVLREVALDLAQGETRAALGDSGCGKTTLLRILAGLLPPDAGTIELEGGSLADCPPQRRGIIYLGQQALLFDHLDCLGNVAFAPGLRGEPRRQREASARALLEATGLLPHARKRAWELSGGQKQRAAFARAILARPKLLLLDEPFGSLDGASRAEMQRLFRDLSRSRGITALFVTHDLKEALLVGDQFARLGDGALRSYDTRTAFLDDASTGIPEEIQFWRGIAHERESGPAKGSGVRS